MSKEVTFSYAHARVPSYERLRLEKKAANHSQELTIKARTTTKNESVINLCQDTHLHTRIHTLVQTIKKLKPRLLLVIGIGGSNLGTMAIQQLVQGKLYNERASSLKVFYADTVDSDEIAEIKEVMERTLKRKECVILNVISKSGTTLETVANFEVLLETLKKHDKNYKEKVIVTSDKDTPLARLAKKERFHVLEIPDHVGGRYSVFSPVGLFPLALAGINIDQILAGARTMYTRCLQKKNNPAAASAALRYWHAHHSHAIQDLFLFGNDFKSLGKWYRQLCAESLGKGCDMQDRMCIGITPTYSIGTTDMHSIAQLYLGGPFDKFTTFVSVKKNKNDVKTPHYKEYESIVKNIQGTSLQKLMNALYQGVIGTFAQKGRAFIEIRFPDKSEYTVGQYIQFQMMEVIYLGHLMRINPFDQPDIESYKQETKKILARKR